MTRFFISIWIISAFTFVLTAVAQAPPYNSDRKYEIAKGHIRNLKKGVLLVRLRTSANSIAALEKQGKLAEAKKLKQQQLAKNKKMQQAFLANYTFTPVYFFDSESESMMG